MAENNPNKVSKEFKELLDQVYEENKDAMDLMKSL
ncbi:hypothetical protein IWT5_01511 [Secundilactobacillus silagincola]|uniref:Uncharacterized protein n=1 Tax=Secundilactobacillus silagincola TaxID=1714681 RepID=A0A1Z5J2X8_9LACO|nr:hypothetical protein IWT5_01511 [Secundilactobacillus silagincola]